MIIVEGCPNPLGSIFTDPLHFGNSIQRRCGEPGYGSECLEERQ